MNIVKTGKATVHESMRYAQELEVTQYDKDLSLSNELPLAAPSLKITFVLE